MSFLDNLKTEYESSMESQVNKSFAAAAITEYNCSIYLPFV